MSSLGVALNCGLKEQATTSTVGVEKANDSDNMEINNSDQTNDEKEAEEEVPYVDQALSWVTPIKESHGNEITIAEMGSLRLELIKSLEESEYEEVV